MTQQAVILKLTVAAELVAPEDNPDGHRLLCGALRDLAALQDWSIVPDLPIDRRG